MWRFRKSNPQKEPTTLDPSIQESPEAQTFREKMSRLTDGQILHSLFGFIQKRLKKTTEEKDNTPITTQENNTTTELLYKPKKGKKYKNKTQYQEILPNTLNNSPCDRITTPEEAEINKAGQEWAQREFTERAQDGFFTKAILKITNQSLEDVFHRGDKLAEIFLGMKTEPTHKQPIEASKIGRNEPCPCGSGKKYKRCCGQ